MNNFIFGQYVPGTSLVHRMNPASKFLLSIVFIILDLVGNNWLNYLELLILMALSILAVQASLKSLYHGIKPLLLLILITTVMQILFDPYGHVIQSLGIIKLTSGGLSSGVLIFFRFSLIILISTLLTLSTPPTALANGIRIILRPLSLLKVPVNLISLMISIALRFVPTLYQELKMIIKAQQSRGMQFHSGSAMARIKKMAMLIIPLLFSSFERARKLSYAMLSRGYQNNVQRTQLHRNHIQGIDILAWVVYLIFGTLEIMTRG